VVVLGRVLEMDAGRKHTRDVLVLCYLEFGLTCNWKRQRVQVKIFVVAWLLLYLEIFSRLELSAHPNLAD
jgi:hypothetical protein